MASTIPDLRIQQAIVVTDGHGVRVLASTEDFDTPEAERIAVLFGFRSDQPHCPLAHFACPFGKLHVAVVRVEDRPDSTLGFRFLILARELYKHLGNPFAIADRYPVSWSTSGRLEELSWPMEVLPERTIEELDAILKHGDGALLLGAAQALVDGNRVLLKRPEPAEGFIRELWQLLPDRTRCHLWPATFTYSNELGFHAAAGPNLPGEKEGPQVLVEEAIRDYPQSSYELNLQIAIESRDSKSLKKLLARRTPDDTIRLGLYLIVFALAAAAVLKFAF